MVRTTERMAAPFSPPLWALALMLATALVVVSPASAQQNSGETVKVAFELTIDGEVPEGRVVNLNLPGTADIGGVFCSTSSDAQIPRCEDGATYTATFFSLGNAISSTFSTVAGSPLSYEYTVYATDGGGPLEIFAADTITPTQDTTVSVTYHAGGPTPVPPTNESGEETEEQPQCFLPEGCFLSGDSSNEKIVGGIGPDYIIGGSGGDALYGLGGGDWLDGGARDDLVRGNEGDDLVDGGSGHDLVIGGPGNDYVTGFTGSDILNGGGGSDFIYAADSEFDRVSGGPGYDVCVAGVEDEVPFGGLTGCEEIYRR